MVSGSSDFKCSGCWAKFYRPAAFSRTYFCVYTFVTCHITYSLITQKMPYSTASVLAFSWKRRKSVTHWFFLDFPASFFSYWFFWSHTCRVEESFFGCYSFFYFYVDCLTLSTNPFKNDETKISFFVNTFHMWWAAAQVYTFCCGPILKSREIACYTAQNRTIVNRASNSFI